MSDSGNTGFLFDENIPRPVKGKGLIHIGTSGYSFSDWKGRFYPEGLSSNRWLEYYARFFEVVEINSTYYRTPSASSFASMAERTPDGFGFWVKLPGEVTHDSEDIQSPMTYFLESVKPLGDCGKLRGFLAQFPFSFKPGKDARDRIQSISEMTCGIPVAVEFRRSDWIDSENLDFLRAKSLNFVSVDLPDLKGLPGRESHLTGKKAYLRFHGRNSGTWYNPELGDRYDYEYSKAELKEWVSSIRKMDSETSSTYIFFNNCHAGQAVKNARMLQQILTDEIERKY